MQLREYAVMTAQEAAARVRDRSVSPVELVGAAYEAIEATDGRINAWCELVRDQALTQARQLEKDAARGDWRGPLHGVPFGVKDLFLTKGIRTRRGSLLYENSIPNETSPVVDRMVAAGAIMVGKNTTPDSGWKASSNSPTYGVTRNPWDPTRTAGGSSSGSAAAVAAGTVPISLGSDGGGSLRIPAAFCGIFSLKPTLGRVPTYPLSSSEHLSHAGAMTITVADSALALDALKGPHELDPYSLPVEATSYLHAIEEPLRGVRCLLAPTLFGQAVDPQIAACVAQAFGRIASMEGVQIVGDSVPWKDPIDVFDRLWVARGTTRIGMNEADMAKLDPGLARMVRRSEGLTLQGHLQALQDRAEFCRQVTRSFHDIDLLITPMLPIHPFAAERDGPEQMDETPPVPWARWTPFSYPFNITGQPAASVPCGWTPAGHPVALQVIGRRFDDAAVLRFCAAWERVFDWRARRPPVFPA